MAEAILTPPPAQAQPVPVTAKTGQAVPNSSGEIRVPAIAAPVEPPPPPKPGSARERMRQELEKRAKPAFGQADPNAPPRPTPPPSQKPADAKPAAVTQGKSTQTTPEPGAPKTEGTKPPEGQGGKAGDDSAPQAKAEGAEPSDEEISAEAKKPGKVNPWKLVETYKKKAAAIEAQLAEKAKLIVDEPARKAEVERLTKAEQRAKELEDHIRYVDYSKSQDFKEKYQEPYEKQWQSAMNDLKELSVTDPNSGDVRPFTANDMLELVNLPLPEARKLANEAFGEYADDVMGQRKEIRQLFDKQNEALGKARTEGAERQSKLEREMSELNGKISKEVSETWKSLNEAITTDEKVGRFFQPIENDDEANARLAKGYELVDSAFTTNPMDPKLKPEERKAILQKHVAVRNRAAAFGKLTHMLSKAEARLAELETELKEYKASTPSTDGQLVPGVPTTAGSAKDRFKQALYKIAK